MHLMPFERIRKCWSFASTFKIWLFLFQLHWQNGPCLGFCKSNLTPFCQLIFMRFWNIQEACTHCHCKFNDQNDLWPLFQSTGQQLCEVEGHTRYVTSCAFSNDSRLLASGSNDKLVMIWKLTTQEDCIGECLVNELNLKIGGDENDLHCKIAPLVSTIKKYIMIAFGNLAIVEYSGAILQVISLFFLTNTSNFYIFTWQVTVSWNSVL